MMTGKEALIALANGEEVEFKDGMEKWENIKHHMNLDLSMFLTAPEWMKFRLKPRTITINGIELPKPSFTCHSTSNSNIIEIGFKTEQEAKEFHLQFRRAWK